MAPGAHIRPSILRVLGITLSFIGVWVGEVVVVVVVVVWVGELGYQGPGLNRN